jgi:hypothetical protein
MLHPVVLQHRLAYNLALNNIGFHFYHVDDCIYHELGRSSTRKVTPENWLVLARSPAACAAGERATIYSMSFLATPANGKRVAYVSRGRNKHATLSHDFLLGCLETFNVCATSRVPDGRHSFVGRFQARLAWVRVAMEARRSVFEIRTEATRSPCGYARFLVSRGRVRTSQRYRR